MMFINYELHEEVENTYTEESESSSLMLQKQQLKEDKILRMHFFFFFVRINQQKPMLWFSLKSPLRVILMRTITYVLTILKNIEGFTLKILVAGMALPQNFSQRYESWNLEIHSGNITCIMG